MSATLFGPEDGQLFAAPARTDTPPCPVCGGPGARTADATCQRCTSAGMRALALTDDVAATADLTDTSDDDLVALAEAIADAACAPDLGWRRVKHGGCGARYANGDRCALAAEPGTMPRRCALHAPDPAA